MELQEEVAVPFMSGACSQYQAQMVGKGRRTKRSRLVIGTSSGGSCDSLITQEDQDMADCLILLARGGEMSLQVPKAEEEVGGKRKPSVELGGAAGGGTYSYECKTCSKVLQSFQALGGHRTSHTKPKSPQTMNSANPDNGHDASNSPASLQLSTSSSNNNNSNTRVLKASSSSSNKVHQCSICGTEFSSGQALGGHMRRHQAPVSSSMGSDHHQSASSSAISGEIITRNFLSFDLNLPAPDNAERHENAAFHLLQLVVFSAHSFVNCRY